MVSNTNSDAIVLGLELWIRKVGWGKLVIKPASAKMLFNCPYGCGAGFPVDKNAT